MRSEYRLDEWKVAAYKGPTNDMILQQQYLVVSTICNNEMKHGTTNSLFVKSIVASEMSKSFQSHFNKH